jgi:hypothetical protein
LSGDIAFNSLVYPVRPGENLEIRAAGDADQGQAGRLRRSARQARWAQRRRSAVPVPAITAFCTMSTETRLVMTIAPSDGLIAGARNGADQLVERIVAADILAHADHALAGR